MRIVQSTWVRYHHFDLARELYQMGHLERIFTCLPWWKANLEAEQQQIPRDLITCNFLMQGIRRICQKVPFYSKEMDGRLAVVETRFYSNWVADNLPECDVYMGISGSGLHAGKLAKSRGAAYIMDRGSTHIRYANRILNEEYAKWNIKRANENEWLMANEEAEINESTLITVPSDFVKASFVEQGVDSNKIKVVPYGVSLSEFYPTGQPPVDKFCILFVGQFSIRKGALYLLEAFKQFKHPKKELIIVGHVSEDLSLYIKQIGVANVKFVGAVPRNEVKTYMSTSHVLVLPSIEEGLALVQAQAMACGCPIIATPNTGSETLFDHEKEGLIIEAMSTNSIIEAFDKLSQDSLLRGNMGNAGLEKVKKLGGWRTYAENMVNIFQGI
ncbi:glycosyltransferase family 4 protein [Parasediminibacterium paludis]|uniref:Glycosyltransferase family 4 protein n=1 Tax=Parasediminibacterium paludis TaxID=908966 RepID=A0ABV8Q1Q5_9BACT